MKVFGVAFITGGLGLVVLSAWAISDPESPIGWSRWTNDPWSQGIFAGLSLTLAGCILLVLARLLGLEARRTTARALGVGVAGVAGFVLMGPYWTSVGCFDGPNGGDCEVQSWGTITGFTFDGEPNIALGLATALLLAGAVLVLTRPSDEA